MQLASGAPYAVGLFSTVSKVGAVSKSCAVTPVWLALKVARRLASCVLYALMSERRDATLAAGSFMMAGARSNATGSV